MSLLPNRLHVRNSVLALALVGLGNSAVTAPLGACESGTAKGEWALPSGSLNGHVAGVLYLDDTSNVRYDWFATLSDVATPCLSCIQGDIDGFLDDGFGPAPDYFVKGSYSGLFLSGRGSFVAYVYPLGSDVAVGKIVGDFRDPPADDVPGGFKGKWEICP